MSVETAQGTTVADRSGRPANMPWVTPYLTVKDVPAALDFYEAAFGFERRPGNAESDGVILHGSMTWNDGVIMLGLEGAYGGTSKAPATSGNESPVSIYVYCDDVDALAQQAEAAGASMRFGPSDMFWGDRCCMLADPNGHVWNFATNKGMPTDDQQG